MRHIFHSVLHVLDFGKSSLYFFNCELEQSKEENETFHENLCFHLEKTLVSSSAVELLKVAQNLARHLENRYSQAHDNNVIET